MAKDVTKGNCYLCGAAYTKGAFKRHILSGHAPRGADVQRCALVKVEDAWEKRYWLYLDIPLTGTLGQADGFCVKYGWNAAVI